MKISNQKSTIKDPLSPQPSLLPLVPLVCLSALPHPPSILQIDPVKNGESVAQTTAKKTGPLVPFARSPASSLQQAGGTQNRCGPHYRHQNPFTRRRKTPNLLTLQTSPAYYRK